MRKYIAASRDAWDMRPEIQPWDLPFAVVWLRKTLFLTARPWYGDSLQIVFLTGKATKREAQTAPTPNVLTCCRTCPLFFALLRINRQNAKPYLGTETSCGTVSGVRQSCTPAAINQIAWPTTIAPKPCTFRRR